ncbi:tryptophan--tRNA ligase [Patescibacteria group bacterium]|nr:tryptophan--tRNA ligase [Patescibacteria group bacterium]
MISKIKKQIVFSGIQPSGNLHLGNYLGAIKQWIDMQQNYSCIFCIVDYHAITIHQDPKELKRRILEIAKIYLASGIDPKKSIIFQQSDIKEHTELAWILNCTARVADLDKMTQFKDKSGKNKESVSVGLYDYPVLMAADILIYGAQIIPVGEDQLQHVELARTIAKRFNSQFGNIFRIPEAQLQKQGARIMGLDDPIKKMSKSAVNTNNYIALNEKPEIARNKIMRAVTDSGGEIKYNSQSKPAISNLLTIYSLITNISIKELEKQYAGRGYGDFKRELAQVVETFLIGFQAKYNKISDKEVFDILKAGATKLEPIAQKIITNVKKNIGLS